MDSIIDKIVNNSEYKKQYIKYLDNLSDIDKELSDIYKVAMDKNSNISVYKIDLYRYKSALLNIKSINIGEEELNYLKSNVKKLTTKSFLLLFSKIISMVAFFINPLSFPCYLLTTILYYNNFIKLNILNEIVNSDTISKKQNENFIIYQNCERFLKKKVEDVENIINYSDTNDITIANKEILNYLEHGKLATNDENIINLMIKILQDDLNTKETSLEKLIGMVNTKLEEMTKDIDEKAKKLEKRKNENEKNTNKL